MTKLLHDTQHIEKGYMNCYGARLTDAEVERYNAISDRIAEWQNAGYTARVTDLNARHLIMSKQK